MTTIKSFTDIEQSRALLEIGISPKSADMGYICEDFVDEDTGEIVEVQRVVLGYIEDSIPCWSLAALLNLLPNEIITDDRFEYHYQIDIRKYDGGDNTTLYQIAYGNNRGLSGSWHDMINTGEKESLIDCCVQMILELHKLNLL